MRKEELFNQYIEDKKKQNFEYTEQAKKSAWELFCFAYDHGFADGMKEEGIIQDKRNNAQRC